MNLSEYLKARQDAIRMSSREIANVCNKKHKRICRDIRRMLEGVGIDPDTLYYQVAHEGKFIDEYQLPKLLVLELCSFYNIELRDKIIERLLALELPTSAEMHYQQAFAIVELERYQKKLAQAQNEQHKQIIANKRAIQTLKEQLQLLLSHVDEELYA